MDISFSEKMVQMKAYARINGLIIGGLMTACFLCMVGSFANPLLSILAQFLVVVTLFVVWCRTRWFRDNVLEGSISFRRAFAYTFYSMIYAGLLMAFAQFVYFQWIDNGYFFSHYTAVLRSEESIEMLKNMGLKETDIDDMAAVFSSLKPLDIAIQFFMSNVFISLIVSPIIATITKRSSRKTRKAE